MPQRPSTSLLAAAAIVALVMGIAILLRSLPYLQAASSLPEPTSASALPHDEDNATIVAPETSSESSAPSATAVPLVPARPVMVRVSGSVPADVVRALQAENDDPGATYRLVSSDDADLHITTDAAAGGTLLAFRVYVPVARFATLRQGITTEALKGRWTGQSQVASALSGGRRSLPSPEPPTQGSIAGRAIGDRQRIGAGKRWHAREVSVDATRLRARPGRGG